MSLWLITLLVRAEAVLQLGIVEASFLPITAGSFLTARLKLTLEGRIHELVIWTVWSDLWPTIKIISQGLNRLGHHRLSMACLAYTRVGRFLPNAEGANTFAAKPIRRCH